MKKVVKFGGSSLASAEQFKKVGDIIRKDESRRYVIPSAPGKRFSNDTKVTDMLYKCYDLLVAEENYMEVFDSIVERYNGIIRDLEIDLDQDFYLDFDQKLLHVCILIQHEKYLKHDQLFFLNS